MFGEEFRNFCFVNRIDRFLDYDGRLYLTPVGFESICRIVRTFDGRKGGLILGKSHSEGGIHLLQRNIEGNFKYVGEMEGSEFLSPPRMSTSDFKILEEINTQKYGAFEQIPPNINIIDLGAEKIQILILAETTQFIVNKYAAMSKLGRISKVVSNYSQHYDE